MIVVVLVVVQNRAKRRDNQTSTKQNETIYIYTTEKVPMKQT